MPVSTCQQYVVYIGVIPAAQHKAISKRARLTNHIERFKLKPRLFLAILPDRRKTP
jgi:hypothetical protein